MRRLLLIGGGGHCRSVLDCIDRELFAQIGICDVEERVGDSVDEIPIIGSDASLMQLREQGFTDAAITLGSIGNPKRRIALFRRALEIGFDFPPIIAPSAVVSGNASIAFGAFVGKGAIVNAGAKVGQCCIINTGAIVEHDCIVNDFVHIAPGAVLSGGIFLGTGVHIGANATVIQNIRIGSEALIGAGSVVVRDIPPGVRAMGNPCRIQGAIR